MYGNDSGSNIGIWGIAIFLLILFACWGGNRGLGFGNNSCGTGWGMPFIPAGGWLSAQEQTTDRDVLKLETAMTAQNAVNNAQLETLARTILTNQDRNAQDILNGQKDLYIRDLEQKATQMFVTQQNEQTRNLIEAKSAQAEAQRQNENLHLQHRLDMIQAEMLKRPPFVPFGGLPVVGCNNTPSSCCNNGCGSWA